MSTLIAPATGSVVFDRGHSMAWRVLTLTLPVLAQQLLVLIVNLSDRYLAGHLVVADRSMQAAYQAAQTSAKYLTWFVSSYTVLVSVGATAVVARSVSLRTSDSRVSLNSGRRLASLARSSARATSLRAGAQ